MRAGCKQISAVNDRRMLNNVIFKKVLVSYLESSINFFEGAPMRLQSRTTSKYIYQPHSDIYQLMSKYVLQIM